MDKILSKQRRYQLRMQAQGKCIICGQLRCESSVSYCDTHRIAHNLRNRVKPQPVTQEVDNGTGQQS